LRFDIADLLFVEDQQTENRSLRHCPISGEQLTACPIPVSRGAVRLAEWTDLTPSNGPVLVETALGPVSLDSMEARRGDKES
jgi:hypothetical protein